MREADIEVECAALAAAPRPCAIDGCPLRATRLVRCGPPRHEVSFWLAVCWYHRAEERPDGCVVSPAACLACANDDLETIIQTVVLTVGGREIEEELAYLRCQACGQVWNHDLFFDMLDQRRRAVYQKQVTEAGGAGQS